MKKRITFIVLLVMILAFMNTAMAATLTIPDPKTMGYTIWFIKNLDNEHSCIRQYMMDDIAQAEDAVNAYVDQLKKYDEIRYVDCTANADGWVYQIFEVADGFSFDEFYIYEDQSKTVDSCVIIQYMPGNRNIYFYFSTDFTMSSDVREATSKPTVAPAPVFVEKPTAAPTLKPTAKPTAEPTAAPTAKTSKQSCSGCMGTGKCTICGGDGRMTDWDWVYENGSLRSKLVTRICYNCTSGKCRKCGGVGWTEE